MAKQYTRAQWQRIQAKLSEDERVPYEDSPDAPIPDVTASRDSRAAAGTYSAPTTRRDGEDSRGATQNIYPTYIPPMGAVGREEYGVISGPTGQQGPSGTLSGPSGTVSGPSGTASGPSGNASGPSGVSDTGVPPGFTAGAFPAGLERFFGSSKGYVGYRIVTNPNGSMSLEVATSPTSWKQFGAKFKMNAAGDYVPFEDTTTSSGGSLGGSTTTTTSSTTGTTSSLYRASDGKTFTDANAYATYQANLDSQRAARQSAYDLLYQQFSQYGLGGLVEPLKNLIQSGVSPSEFTLRLRETDAYKNRFAANAQRIAKGLSALSEAEYIKLEDQYQNIMRNYGMPESYYAQTTDPVTGVKTQPGFQKFIAGDVSPAELEDRIQTAQNRILYANPEVGIALKTFYPDITNGDILGYVLDPQTGLSNIKRRITAAEIGGTAVQLGLTTNLTDAEYLARYGVTKQQAQQGYQTIAGGLQRGSELASIYGQTPYTQTTAEQEVFGVPGATEAQQKRKQLIGLERATFAGQSGAGGALARERAGGF